MNHAITFHDVLKIGGYGGGAILAIGGFGLAFLSAWANQMRDAPSEDSGAAGPAIVGCVGVGMIVGAFFIP